ncbi:cupin domain-containing protein [Streptomyces sp. NPDC056600]|uniref:cupin domain-containing protein n=1 Tax=Streptomyces sp. NPDC056600 TaxID=3345874 RepID=UPI0036AAD937
MSLILPDFSSSVVVRAADAEVTGRLPAAIRLLADSSATGGALSVVRATLTGGADGARPHRHDNSAEMFFMVSGTARLLSGEEVVTAGPGDLVVVPPGMPHAFAAPPGHDADILVVITPGVERFDYFRHLRRIALGEASPESLLDVQERYDTHFLRSGAWEAERSDERERER